MRCPICCSSKHIEYGFWFVKEPKSRLIDRDFPINYRISSYLSKNRLILNLNKDYTFVAGEPSFFCVVCQKMINNIQNEHLLKFKPESRVMKFKRIVYKKR